MCLRRKAESLGQDSKENEQRNHNRNKAQAKTFKFTENRGLHHRHAYLSHMHRPPFRSHPASPGCHDCSHALHLSIDFPAIYQKICTLKLIFHHFYTGDTWIYIQVTTYHADNETEIRKTLGVIVTCQGRARAHPSSRAIDSDSGRASLCVLTGCGFSMPTRGGSPTPVGSTWKIDRGL